MVKKLNTFEKVLFFANLLFAIVLLFCYLVPYIPPKNFPRLSVLSLATPLFIIINVLFSVYWLFRLKKPFWCSAVVLLLGYHHLGRFVQLWGGTSIGKQGITLMSFNARLFNHYNWHSDPNLEDKIMAFIHSEKPDILVVQEFYKHKKYEPQYAYKQIISKKKSDNIGGAVFSNFPIIGTGSLDFPKTGNNGIFTDIVIKQDTIRVYSLHLESLHISPKEEDLLQEDKKQLLKNIGRRFVLQQEQAEIFRKHQQKSPYRTIVCGDFNNTAYSYVYRQIKGENLNDAFTQAGQGFGSTFHFKYFPLRIDYILLDKSLKINHFQKFEENLSDHYPIMVDFSF